MGRGTGLGKGREGEWEEGEGEREGKGNGKGTGKEGEGKGREGKGKRREIIWGSGAQRGSKKGRTVFIIIWGCSAKEVRGRGGGGLFINPGLTLNPINSKPPKKLNPKPKSKTLNPKTPRPKNLT